MERKISHLQPVELWGYFEGICSVPRPSKKEEKIIAYLEQFAANHNLTFKKDETGNVLIVKAASPGFEGRKTVVLQSHLDMVCEKNSDRNHNFETDPIKPYIDEGWVRAEGTTLGADCGIGIAAQLAVLSSNSLEHGPIECLFTVDEETGLTGAFALQPDFLTGKILLNLDSEDEGELFIGCAGGIDTLAVFDVEYEPTPLTYFPIELTVSGLLGGHSGDDIDKGRSNAIKILVRFLWEAKRKFDIRISSILGGNLRNAIAREASVVLLLPWEDKESFVAAFNIYKTLIADEIADAEPHHKLGHGTADKPDNVLCLSDSERILNALYACPHGIVAMSRRMPGMVETSTNLAAVRKLENNMIEVTTSQRSDRESSKNMIAGMVESVFLLANAKVVHTDGYPGWTPNPASEIVQITQNAYLKLFGQKPVVRSIHAGLECGLFLEKYAGMDMVSFGPTIRGAHSPDERLEIKTVSKFWDLLNEVLRNIPEA
jgi:dipeptidase D